MQRKLGTIVAKVYPVQTSCIPSMLPSKAENEDLPSLLELLNVILVAVYLKNLTFMKVKSCYILAKPYTVMVNYFSIK